jgi:hypothetical protein
MTLHFLYYINLDRAQIRKAMWCEISPNGRWIWTSSGRHLLVYPAAAVNRNAADRQRAGASRGLTGRDLGAVLPVGGVTGAAFYEDALSAAPRLVLALSRRTYSEVVSFRTGSTRDGRPRLLSTTPRSEIVVPRSPSHNESEGLTVTGVGNALNPLGGMLHWLMLPVVSRSSVYSTILSYLPEPPGRAPHTTGFWPDPGAGAPGGLGSLRHSAILPFRIRNAVAASAPVPAPHPPPTRFVSRNVAKM